jgi:hypothetical protein
MDTLARLEAGQLAGITRLDLSCGLTEFPQAIFSLANSLQVLNLSGNALSSLPADLHRLHKLEVLFCSDNRFTELPACIGQCHSLRMVGFKANRIEQVPAEALPPRLRWLILTDNCITQLPDALGDCTEMQKLMLAGNRLSALPDLSRMARLELLRLSINALPALPDWLLRLPRLAWLAYAGNPLPAGFNTPEQQAPTPAIGWSQLRLQEVLGQGASGVIHRALREDGHGVAVKLYKGEVTSDGSPLNEMSACLQAGLHDHLIALEGRVHDHPEGIQALVMALIDPAYLNLAGPPSLASCSRDVYAETLRLSPLAVWRMAAALASVGAHLHSLGINHGDLYAHNVLYQADGHCLLGDFGAAAFYPRDNSEWAHGLERIEVRAYGILLGELLEHCDSADERLRAVQERCTQPDVATRPSFAEVLTALDEAQPAAA